MRIFYCSIVIILIALQSVSAIAAQNSIHTDNHQDSHQGSYQDTHLSTHQNNQHQDSAHHSKAELLAFQAQALDGEPVHSDADHPDCHANHCHHSSFVYLDLSTQMHLSNTIDKQVSTKNTVFSSIPTSPDSRPPIV